VTNWQLQEAKQRFSEVVRRAVSEGPQVVTRHGAPTVVVISADEYKRLSGEKRDLLDALMDPSAPYFDDLDLERSKELPPDIDL
jgi:antitoxin Phd